MKQYLVTGLCKREYRGKGRDTATETTVEAGSAKEAGAKFEEANKQYSAVSVKELPKTKPADVREDSDIDGGRDLASEHDEDN